MQVYAKRLDGAGKVLVALAKKPLFPEVIGNAVAVSDRLIRDDLMTSVPVFCITCSFREWPDDQEKMSREIPGLPTEKCAALDSRGIIKRGSVVSYGDILVGKVALPKTQDLAVEEHLLRAIFGRSDSMRDCSLYYRWRDSGVVCGLELLARHRYSCSLCGDVPLRPHLRQESCPFCKGLLTDYQHDDLPSGVTHVVKVAIVVPRRLHIGDVLRDGKGNVFTVARIVQQREMPSFKREDVDVLMAADCSITSHLHRRGSLSSWQPKTRFNTSGDYIRLEKVTMQYSDKIVYRGVSGPYHSFTELPIADDTTFPGQKVDAVMLKALLVSGYTVQAREMMSIKADAVEGRSAAYEALMKGEPIPFGVPATTTRLWTILKALCFVPGLMDESGNDVTLLADAGSVTSLALRGMTTAEVRAESFGEVKNPRTINFRTYRGSKGGLFCECIFGPHRDWECSCGKYHGLKFKGMICDRCGVKVTRSRVRRKRLGHLELALPVVHPWYIAMVSDVLNLTQEEVWKVLSYDQELDMALATRKGPLAIAEHLLRTGVNSKGVILETLPVLPAGLRPMVLEEDGEWLTHDCNELYCRVINRNNRLQKLCQLNAPAVIIENEHRMLQNTVAALFCNELLPHPVVTNQNRVLHSLRWVLSDLLKQMSTKRVNYSARMVVVPNCELQPSTIGVPIEALYEVYRPLVIRELKARGLADPHKTAMKLIERESWRSDVQEALVVALSSRPLLLVTEEYKMAALQPVIVQGEALQLHPDDARRLAVRFAGEQVMLHLPLSNAAIAELHQPRPLEDTSSALLGSWLDDLSRMICNQEPLDLKPLDKIILGIGQ